MGGEWWIRRAGPEDGEAVSEVLRRAGIAGWGGYLGAARIDRAIRGSSHPADLGWAPRTADWYDSRSRRVIGPVRPPPTARPSTLATPTTSAAVPQTNTSSAMYR